jgi:glycosyltransferase involved in cell wall biosynthesis
MFVDDCSTDGTPDALRSLLDQHGLSARFEIIVNSQRRYKTYHVFHALQGRGMPDEVVVMLDGDDQLAGDDALDRLAREYEAGWEIVWSNWRGSDGSRGTSSHLNPFLSPRQQAFVTSHVFSFRRRLFDAVVASDLQDDDGRWFEAGTDVAIAWPLLEQTIKRKHIEDVLYIYNRSNPQSHDKSGAAARPLVSQSQAQTSALLRRRPSKELIVDHEFLHAHLYEFMQAAMQSARIATRQEIVMALAAKDANPKRPRG